MTWYPIKLNYRLHHYKGKLYTVDGVDGAGKTTYIEKIKDLLESRGLEYVMIKSPSLELREYPFWKAWYDESYGHERTCTFGFGLNIMALGDRLVQQELRIIPALKQGKVVLCDRYGLSSVLHHSKEVHKLLFKEILKPDLQFFIQVSYNDCISRLEQRDYETLHPEDQTYLKEMIHCFKNLLHVNEAIIFDSSLNNVDACWHIMNEHLENDLK